MAKKRKNIKNNSGCISFFAELFGIGIAIITLLSIVIGILCISVYIILCVALGATKSVPLLLFLLFGYIVYKIIFYCTHKKPLTYEQVKKLSKKYAKKYVNKQYKFKKGSVSVNPAFKSNLDINGRWYEINEPVDTFPSYISALLKGKHHEWIVVAIERNGIVYNMWVNKGTDSQSASLNCDIADIILKCKEVGGYSVLRFHNHPNPDPRRFTTLLASEQDKISARSCSEVVCNEGINWFDFVCARGEFVPFFSKISDGFEVEKHSVSDIIDLCGITPKMDYQLQKELFGINVNTKYKYLVPIVVIVLCVFFVIGLSIGLQ